ncbi:MAG TPA: sulfite exporter TauE/SafE family protein [Longimicrobiales bacterium]|nr:sulfite exporter TauE/SafE family protein [Longimicrobiales bacterium]
MSPAVIASLLGAGLAAGFTAGLVGVGGGVVIVPLLYFFYAHPAWSGAQVPASMQAVVAHATSLLVIVPTTLVGAVTYQRARLVAWRAVVPLAAGAVVAAVAGAELAPRLPAELLKVLFGLVLLYSAQRLLRQPAGNETRRERAALPFLLLAGLAVGLVSSLLGVGGGIVAIPVLIHLVGLDLKKVAATSIGIIVFTAAAGVATYMATPVPAGAAMPPGSVGYVHVAAAVPILLTSTLMAPVGAKVNQRLNARALRGLFAVLFLLLGLRLIVVNLPRLL